MARSFSAYVAVFWGIRLALQAVFDIKEYLITWWTKAGYFALTLMFTALVIVYSWAALQSATSSLTPFKSSRVHRLAPQRQYPNTHSCTRRRGSRATNRSRASIPSANSRAVSRVLLAIDDAMIFAASAPESRLHEALWGAGTQSMF